MATTSSSSLPGRVALPVLALFLATFAVACTLLPPLFHRSQPPADRAGEALREGARVFLEHLSRPVEPDRPAIYLRFDGPHLWRSLALLASLAAAVAGGWAAFRSAQGRPVAVCAAIQGLLVFFWHFYLT